MNRFPDFIIMGAMKCATSTLHDQLATQPGLFTSTPKEPNFFSNDERYAQGIEWYRSLFQAAKPGDLCGESSTHYTKLPTYPHTIERIQTHIPNAKFIYVMRHPVDRLVSHFVHEWSQRRINTTDINQALDQHQELIQYSQYSMQLKPYLETFGSQNVLPVFFERLCQSPQEELERVCRFIGYPHSPKWQDDLSQRNASSERMRKSAWRDLLVETPVLRSLRQTLVPKSLRDRIRSLWTLQQKPQLNPQRMAELQATFDQDLALLGAWLGVDLSCATFKTVALSGPQEWVGWANPAQSLSESSTKTMGVSVSSQ